MDVSKAQRKKEINKDGVFYRKINAHVAAICLDDLCLESERIRENGRRDDGVGSKDNSGLIQLLSGCMRVLDKKKPPDNWRPGPHRPDRRDLRK